MKDIKFYFADDKDKKIHTIKKVKPLVPDAETLEFYKKLAKRKNHSVKINKEFLKEE